jgi:hypothetical protein
MDMLIKFLHPFYILVLVFSTPMLFYPSSSLAYLSAPLSPIYKVNESGVRTGCGIYIAKINNTGGTCSTLLGYLATAKDTGMMPLYQLFVRDGWGRCTATISNLNNTGGICATLLGYIASSKQAGMVPLYLVKMSGGRTGCGTYVATVNNTGGTCATLLGYVYPSIPAPDNYTVSPKYFIGSVRYVPPGAGSSSITYGAGNVTGTTVSTEQSWSVSSSAGVSIGSGNTGSATIAFGNSYGGSTSQSVDMQRTSSSSEKFSAPSSDYINHDYDIIQIYLGVNVIASVDYLGKVTWSVDFSQVASQGYAENGYNIAVGCIRPYSTIPLSNCASTLNLLSAVGIMPEDYPNILGANPFADPSASQIPDYDRYVLIDAVSYFYQPTTSTYTYMENNTTNITNSNKSTYSYSVDASTSLPGGFLKASSKFTWTNSSTQSNKTGSSNASSFTLSNPSSAYNGPTVLFVYMDTIYKTFMFSFE